MPDWSSPVTIGQTFSGAQALLYICIGLMLSDTARYATFDWSILSGKRARRWPQIPYLFSKLCYWTYILTNLYFVLALKEFNCNGVLQGVEIQMGLITVSSSMLLACRAVCVYTGRERQVVATLLTIFTLGMLTAWMVGVPDGVAAWVPNGGNPWQEGACTFVSISPKYSIKYIVTIAFDLSVMLLTVIGVLRMNGSSRIGSVLVQQGIVYFLCTFVINALVTILTLLQYNPVVSLIGAVPASTVCVMCSTRLYVKLADEAQHRPGGVSNSTQISSSSTGEKIARLFKRSGNGRGGSFNSASQQNSYTLRNGSQNGVGAAGGYNVTPLKYGRGTNQPGDASPTNKSMDGIGGSSDDLEAQAHRNKSGFVAITESQIVTSEPMPEYLAGTEGFRPSHLAEAIDHSAAQPIAGGHPYSNEAVKSHFPRLSKS